MLVYMRNYDDPGAHGKGRWLLRPTFELTFLTAAAALTGALLFSFQKAAGLSWVDGAARSVVALHVHPWINRLMTDITSLGGEICLFLAFCALALWSYRTRGGQWARFFTLVMVGALALDNLVKPLVGRPRPILDQLVGARGASFPSGHATATTALLIAVGYYLASGRAPRVRTCIWATALLGSVLMGVTRVYLGVHWPTDVIAGMVLGASWTLMCARSQEVTKGLRLSATRTPDVDTSCTPGPDHPRPGGIRPVVLLEPESKVAPQRSTCHPLHSRAWTIRRLHDTAKSATITRGSSTPCTRNPS